MPRVRQQVRGQGLDWGLESQPPLPTWAGLSVPRGPDLASHGNHCLHALRPWDWGLGAHLTQALSLLACTCFLSPLKTEGSQAPWPWPARNTSLVTETMLISLCQAHGAPKRSQS